MLCQSPHRVATSSTPRARRHHKDFLRVQRIRRAKNQLLNDNLIQKVRPPPAMAGVDLSSVNRMVNNATLVHATQSMYRLKRFGNSYIKNSRLRLLDKR